MKRAYTFLWVSVLTVCWVLPTHAATISYVGTHLDAEGGLANTNAGWRVSTQPKPLDIDGDNIYGTAGYYLVDPWTVSPVTASTTRVSYPLYIRSATPAAIAGNYPNYAIIDDPQNPGQFIRSGTCYNNAVGLGTNDTRFTFVLGGKTPDTFRVGVLLDNVDSADIPLEVTLTQTVGAATGVARTSTAQGNMKPDWVFFDVHGGQSNDTFQVWLMPITNAGAARLGGLVWDSLPPVVPLVSTTGGASHVMASSATLNGYLSWTGSSPTRVSTFWGITDGGTNVADWAHTSDLGDLPIGPLSVPVTGLTDGSVYHYTFCATNAAGSTWAPNAAAFVTPLRVITYAYKMQITFPGYTRDESLTNFPALIVLGPDAAPTGFAYRQFASTNGFDLRFQNSDETYVLSHEIEAWSTASNSLIWVNIPLLTSNTCIWAYWGNPGIASAPAEYTTNGSTWANGAVGVWHLQETPGNGVTFADATRANAGTFRDLGSSHSVTTNGIVGPAVKFSGSTNYLEIANQQAFNLGGSMTVSAWIKGLPAVWQPWVSKNGEDDGWQLRNENGFAGFTCRGAGGDWTGTNTSVRDGNWHYVAGMLGHGRRELYVDGVLDVGQNQTGSISTNAVPVIIGARNRNGTMEGFFNGAIDEVRIDSVGRSANWIWATWANMASNSVFNSIGMVTRINAPRTVLSIY